MDLSVELCEKAVRDLGGHRRLADATGPHERDEALRFQSNHDPSNGVLAADQGVNRSGQGMALDALASMDVLAIEVARDRRDEAVSATCDIGDVAGAASPVTERFAQRNDVISQASIIDHEAAPDPLDQVSLADDFRRAVHERDQNVERSTAHSYGETVLLEQSFRSA